MRILHILNHAQRANGHVEVAIDLACKQADLGYDVAFASGSNDFTDCLKAHNVQVFKLNEFGSIWRSGRFIADTRSAILQFRPDIVHSHMVAANVAARLVKLGTNITLISTVHNPFDKQARFMGFADRTIERLWLTN